MNIEKKVDKDNSIYPKKILQFGQGNFLRGFTDWMIDLSNDKELLKSSIVIAKVTENGNLDKFKKQNNKYTLIMKGIENNNIIEEKKLITSISQILNPYEEDDFSEYEKIIKSEELEIIISNTTEAGILYEQCSFDDQYPKTFPAKVTKLLYTRFKYFNGDKNKGILFLPVELIDNNGEELKKCILNHIDDWKLEKEFEDWVLENNYFTNTLVDRIVTGYPKDNIEEIEKELGYKDELLVSSEYFNLWVIEGDEKWKSFFSLGDIDANIIWTNDVSSFKKRKVRILNGGHTSLVPSAFLSGTLIVRDMINYGTFNKFYDYLMEREIIPTIDMDERELLDFAESVKDRFKNPFIDHRLQDIMLNSLSKYKARCLPSLKDYYYKFNDLPKGLVYTLAALLRYYKVKKSEDKYFGYDLNGKKYVINDNIENLEFMKNCWSKTNIYETVVSILGNKNIWGEDLNNINNLTNKVVDYINSIENIGVIDTIEEIL